MSSDRGGDFDAHDVMNEKQIGMKMKDRGFERKRGSVNGTRPWQYVGLSLKPHIDHGDLDDFVDLD